VALPISPDGEFTPELVDKATKKANSVIEDALADVQEVVKELKDACITWSNHAHQGLQSVGMDRVEKKKRWLQNHEEQEKQWQQNHEKKKREWLQDEDEEDQHLETVMALFSNGRTEPASSEEEIA